MYEPVYNHVWVCFDCRRAHRRDPGWWGSKTQPARCSQCGGACRDLGSKVRIPRRSDEGAWEALRTRTFPGARDQAIRSFRASHQNVPEAPLLAREPPAEVETAEEMPAREAPPAGARGLARIELVLRSLSRGRPGEG